MADDPAPPFWLVWRRHGRTPVFEHESYHQARAEAERLASKCPGSAFYVLAPVARGGPDQSSICWSHYAWTEIGLLDDFGGEHAPAPIDG